MHRIFGKKRMTGITTGSIEYPLPEIYTGSNMSSSRLTSRLFRKNG